MAKSIKLERAMYQYIQYRDAVSNNVCLSLARREDVVVSNEIFTDSSCRRRRENGVSFFGLFQYLPREIPAIGYVGAETPL